MAKFATFFTFKGETLETHELFTADQLAPLVAKAKAVRGAYKAPGA